MKGGKLRNKRRDGTSRHPSGGPSGFVSPVMMQPSSQGSGIEVFENLTLFNPFSSP